MQTLINNSQLIQSLPSSEFYPVRDYDHKPKNPSVEDKLLSLKAIYRQLFKANRDLDFHHNPNLDSAYLNSKLTTRSLVCELLCSDMYINYVLSVNSNFRFVELCFERVLGRQATPKEINSWSSLLASKGLRIFAQELTNCDEYMVAFGDRTVPYRRSQSLPSSNQGIPALPKELSIKRYKGEGNYKQYYTGPVLPWKGTSPPYLVRKIGAVFAVAGTIEVVRLIFTIAWQAYNTGSI